MIDSSRLLLAEVKEKPTHQDFPCLKPLAFTVFPNEKSELHRASMISTSALTKKKNIISFPPVNSFKHF